MKFPDVFLCGNGLVNVNECTCIPTVVII